MVQLTPPLNKVTIGTDSLITLFNEAIDCSTNNRYVDESIVQLCMKKFGHRNVLAIACYNSYYGFFIEKNSEDQKVYSFNTLLYSDELIEVASSLEILYKMILQIESIFKKYQGLSALPKSFATLNQRKQFLIYMSSNSQTSSTEFWDDLLFRSLIINLY